MDFFTSDTHFGHLNIIKYCERPFDSVESMNRAMIDRWNAVVSDSDTVYHLGDFALGPKLLWKTYRYELNGQIIFIAGNHDNVPLERFKREAMLPVDEVHEQLLYQSEYGRIHLAHIPVGGDPERGFERAGEGVDAVFYFCGHVHNAWLKRSTKQGVCINVGVDMWDFQPRTVEEIILGSVFRDPKTQYQLVRRETFDEPKRISSNFENWS
jgi:calcineurin-like phosphoesterase family protein